ncbi:MAG TPA: hypothetical protein VI231_15230 [Candidatus Binatia bacterium]
MAQPEALTNGAAAAVILAAGVGSLTLGVVTAVSEVAGSLRPLMAFYRPAGPLSGRTMLAVVVWLASWLVLHILWKNRRMDFSRIFMWTLLFVALGLVGTFPPPFEALGNLLRCMRGAPAQAIGQRAPGANC